MSTVYSKRGQGADERRSPRALLRKKQLQILDEDARLKRLQKSQTELKKELTGIEKDFERHRVEVDDLARRQGVLRRELSTVERSIQNQQAVIRRMEHEAEQARQGIQHRDTGDRDDGP